MNLLILGDFNIHADHIGGNSAKFVILLERYGFKLYVKWITHSGGHTLELLITHDSGQLYVLYSSGIVDKQNTNLENHKQNYIVKCKTIFRQLDDSNRSYYSSRTNQHKTNSKQLFRLTKEFIEFNGDVVLLSHINKEELSQLFNFHCSD